MNCKALLTSCLFAAFATTVSAQVNIDQAWLDSRGSGPYYLDQPGQTYVLQTDVSVPGTAFVTIGANITLDLNDHVVTYNADKTTDDFNGSFEEGQAGSANGWMLTPEGTRFAGSFLANEIYDGQHSLRLAAGINHHVESKSEFHVQAGVTYSLSGMFYRKPAPAGTTLFVQLINPDGSVFQEVIYSGGNNRGIQFAEKVFTAAAAGTYSMRAGVRGGSGSAFVFIDDIKLQRTRVYGVCPGAVAGSTEYPGVTRFGVADNFTLKNGEIKQGNDSATWSHGVYVRRSRAVGVEHVKVTVKGPNSNCVGWSAPEGFITDCQLTSNVRTIASRDQFDGAVVNWFKGQFLRNTITNGVHAGLNLDNGISVVSGNTIRTRTKYTNSFAIVVRGNTEIFSNRIECHVGDYASRGILVSGGTQGPIRIHQNNVQVQLLRNNQEYGGGDNQGAMLGGCYGIQIEEAAANVEVFNNDVTAYANEVRAYAFRLSSDNPLVNVRVHDNTFRAVSNGQEAASLKLLGQGSVVPFEDNRLVTNDMWVGDSRVVVGFALTRPTLELEPPVSSRVLQSENWNRNLASAVVDLRFINPVYVGDGAQQRLETAFFINRRANNQPDPFSTFVIEP